MLTTFTGKTVSGIVSVLPEHEHSFEETIIAESLNRVKRLRRIMGFDKRYRAKKDTCVSDMYKFGIRWLMEREYIKKEEVGAIITVTLTPDYVLPSVSHLLHGEFGFDENVVCVDISQGCAGYISGLLESFMLLDCCTDKKILLCTGDIFNRETEHEGKYEEPSFGGDAASVSIIENTKDESLIYANYYTDGKNGESLLMPAGAFKYPLYKYEDRMVTLDNGKYGNGAGIWMDGSEVFNFIMKEVPPMIEEILEFSGLGKDEIEHYFFHQPNRYILEKLADKLQIDRKKMPMNVVEKYGNSNSSTIPVAICGNSRDEMMAGKKYCCLSGFGSGLTWASLVMQLGGMEFCDIIHSDL